MSTDTSTIAIGSIVSQEVENDNEYVVCYASGIGLVFGFRTSPDGYIGLLIITEFISKGTFEYLIKSKTAVEIAEKLFLFICLLGPFKEMMSDQGKEFINSIVFELLKRLNINHRTTSPSNPRTNELTKRINQTVVSALRKQASDDTENWDKYVPYIFLAYRRRIHSTTNLCLYKLLFGRKMNG